MRRHGLILLGVIAAIGAVVAFGFFRTPTLGLDLQADAVGLHRDDVAVDPAGRDHLVADLQVGEHLLVPPLLLTLRPDHQEVDEPEHRENEQPESSRVHEPPRPRILLISSPRRSAPSPSRSSAAAL